MRTKKRARRHHKPIVNDHSITILTVVWYLINPWAPKNSSGKIRAKCSETEDLNAPPPNLEIGFEIITCQFGVEIGNQSKCGTINRNWVLNSRCAGRSSRPPWATAWPAHGSPSRAGAGSTRTRASGSRSGLSRDSPSPLYHFGFSLNPISRFCDGATKCPVF